MRGMVCMNKFQVRTEVRFGEDALDSLSEFKYENAVIVTDPFMVKSGTADIIAKKLTSCKNISVFGDVKPNPPIELVDVYKRQYYKSPRNSDI